MARVLARTLGYALPLVLVLALAYPLALLLILALVLPCWPWSWPMGHESGPSPPSWLCWSGMLVAMASAHLMAMVYQLFYKIVLKYIYIS